MAARCDFATSNVGNNHSFTLTGVRAQFRITVSSTLSLVLRIGSAGGTIDTVQFDLSGVPPASASHPSPFSPPFGLGSGTQAGIAGSLNGAPTGAPTVQVAASVASSLSTVQLHASVLGTGLVSGPNNLPYTQITATSSSPANLPSPAIPASGNGATQAISGCDTSCSGTVNRSATWTYQYANTVVPPAPGIYTGQISYTATSP